MKKVKLSKLMLYALFLAVFKPYFIPTIVQQTIKCGLVLCVLLYIVSKGKKEELFNISILFCASVVISGLINYSQGLLKTSSVFDAVLYAICIYCIYTLIAIVSRQNSAIVVSSLWEISALYCVLSLIDLFLPHSVDSSGLIIYLWGNKFTSSYLFVFMVSLFFVEYHEKMMKSSRWKLKFYLLVLISVLYAVKVECSTAVFAFVTIILFFLFQEQIRPLSLKPQILLIAMAISAAFPFFVNRIMEIDIVQRFIVEVLREGRGLSGRIALYERYVFFVLSKQPYFGYGYGTTQMFEITGFYGNTQNGLLDIIYKFGIVGTTLFLLLAFRSFRKSARTEKNISASVLVYSIIVAGMVEVTYGWFFFFGVSLVRWLNWQNDLSVSKIRKIPKSRKIKWKASLVVEP